MHLIPPKINDVYLFHYRGLFSFQVNALPGYQVIPQERVANNIQYFRDFTRRISRAGYIDAAQQLGATNFFM
jgi:hypothetical protein